MDYDALLDTTRDAIGIIENVLDLEYKLNQLGVFDPKPFEREVRRVFDSTGTTWTSSIRRVELGVGENTLSVCTRGDITHYNVCSS